MYMLQRHSVCLSLSFSLCVPVCMCAYVHVCMWKLTEALGTEKLVFNTILPAASLMLPLILFKSAIPGQFVPGSFP